MNKLTTINTITKAAPLALLAVVMSGSAFAGKNDNPGKGKKGEPQGSLDVVVTCSLCDPNNPYYDPKNYVNCSFDTSNPTMYVSAEIKDETGDFEPDETVVVPTIDVEAFGLRRDMGGKDAWTSLTGYEPAVAEIGAPLGKWETMLKPCELDDSISEQPGGAKAISALVNVTITNLDASKDTYSGQCENIIVNEDLYDGVEDEDLVDQSNFNVKELGISCDVPEQP